jgi:hypothetical protein
MITKHLNILAIKIQAKNAFSMYNNRFKKARQYRLPV